MGAAGAQLPQVTGLRKGQRDAAQINAVAVDLKNYFLMAFHFRDALIEDGVVPKQIVLDAIKASPVLALLADLANLHKDRKLNRPLSCEPPTINVSEVSSDDTWRLRMVITHKGVEIDGAAFATQVMETWRVLWSIGVAGIGELDRHESSGP